MTLPTTTTLNGCDDDSDMFGPPRSSPPIGYRSRVPMISPKLRQREERKRILQLCAHKLERIKDSETNLRRSVCINNTYCRLTDELRREKQSRYLANLPKSEVVPETARENIFNPYNSCGIDSSNHQPSNRNNSCSNNNNENACNNQNNNNNNVNETTTLIDTEDHIDVVHDDDDPDAVFKQAESNNNEAQTTTLIKTTTSTTITSTTMNDNNNNHVHNSNSCHNSTTTSCSITSCCNTIPSSSSTTSSQSTNMRYKRHQSNSSNTLDNDLEILDRELNAINAPPLLIDPEITQGAEQLEKALLSSSRKRARIEDESDRLVREALSQFYIPPQRFISAIEDCPLDLVSVGVGNGVNMHGMRHEWHMGGLGVTGVPTKRAKLDYEANISYTTNNNNNAGLNDLELDFDMNPNQKDFEVIMDALRLGTPSPTNSNDSCGQAAMMLSESASVFHNLVVASLET